ncbi:FEKKY domain-containing protein [Sinomicrobium sp. M5D2P17]
MKLLLNLTLILSYGISFAQIEINGQIKSSITDSNPITDIYIEQLNSEKLVVERMTMADSSGYFKLENLEPNKLYEIKISTFGYEDQVFEIKTNDGITKTTLTLDAECEFSREKAESDWKNGQAKLLLIGSIAPIANSSTDNRFEKKFRIKYYDFGCEPPIQECVKIYNERIFELMDEKYGKKWRKKVRSDVEHLK